MTHGILTLICHCLPLSIHVQTHPQLIPMKLGPTCGNYHFGGNMENAVEETIETLNETRCHSWKIVFNKMNQFGLMYPPFCSLHSNIKRLCSYYWKERGWWWCSSNIMSGIM